LLDRLAGDDDELEVQRRHAAYFTGFAETAEPDLTRDPAVIERVGRDHDNIRAALAWTIQHDEARLGMRLGYAVWRFWHQRGHLREGRQWFERLLALPSAHDRTPERAKGLIGAAGIAYWQNDYPAAEGWYLEAEAIYRELGDEVGLADALYNTGSMAALRGDMETVWRKLGEGGDIGRRMGDEEIEARFLQAEGYMAFMIDDLDRARPVLEHALEMAERSGERMPIAVGNHTVGQVARLQGRWPDAASHYRNAIRAGHELGDAASLTEPLQGLAAVLIATGDAERGVRLLGANAAIRDRLGGGPPPEWLRLGDPLTDARQLIDDDAHAREWQRGSEMTVDEAVADALDESPSVEAAG